MTTIPAPQRINTSESRKEGDAIILSGPLNEGTPMLDAAWIASSGKMNIVDATTRALVVDHAAVTLTIDVTPKRYLYIGGPLPVGTYQYEIEVTFPGLPAPLTWPNDKSVNELIIVTQLG